MKKNTSKRAAVADRPAAKKKKTKVDKEDPPRKAARPPPSLPLAPPIRCNPNHFSVEMYTNRSDNLYPTMSAEDQRHLQREFLRGEAMERSGDPRRSLVRLCRGQILSQFALRSLHNAAFVVIGRYHREIVGMITVFRSDQLHPDERKPFCLPHELYVDVVCSYVCPRGCGGQMITAFLRHARTVEGAKAVRLHTTARARTYWAETWQFVEAETKLLRDGRCVHGTVKPRHYEHEECYGIAPTYRMTRLL